MSDESFFRLYKNTVVDGGIADDAFQVVLEKFASGGKIAKRDGSIHRNMLCYVEPVDGG